MDLGCLSSRLVIKELIKLAPHVAPRQKLPREIVANHCETPMKVCMRE